MIGEEPKKPVRLPLEGSGDHNRVSFLCALSRDSTLFNDRTTFPSPTVGQDTVCMSLRLRVSTKGVGSKTFLEI